MDGEVYKSYEVDYKTYITPEPAPTKEGYTFSGWSGLPMIMPNEDVVVTGFFTINSYTLTYKLDGKVYKTSTVVYGTSITPETVPAKIGYTFSGWSGLPTTMPAKDVTVTGSYIANNYTIIYKIDGVVYKTYTIAYGTPLTLESEPTKEGYTFSGWSNIPTTMPAHDVTVTGSFSVNSYTLTYEIDHIDYREYKSCTIAYGTTITPEEEPSKEGYTFSGWIGLPTTMPAHDVVVTGSFIANKYFLIYKVDGKAYKTVTIVYGTDITPEEEPSKEGYTFSGWSDIPTTMPAHDVTVTGSFSINSYTITYMVDGEVYRTSTVVYGTTITPESALTKEGYTFSGWSTIPAKMPAHDVVVTGSFTVNQYMLTYIVDGKKYKSYEIDYNSVLFPELVPIKKGMTFSGWGEVPETMPAHDVTLRGTYSWSQRTLNNAIYQVTDTLNNYVSVIGNDKVFGNVKILSSVEIDGYSYTVTTIESKAFLNCNELTSVTIPESVTGISINAFNGCSNLYTVTLESNNIVSKAYSSKSSLKNIFGIQVEEYIIGDKVTSIGSYAFSGCSGLLRVTIPKSVTSIGQQAFYGCTNVEKLIYAEGCTKAVSTDLTSVSEVNFPQTLQSIDEKAFYGFIKLKEITIPSSVTSIGQQAFYGCTNVEKLIYGKGCTKTLSTGLTSVSEVSLPQTLQSIEPNAFANFKNLKEITIPSSVTSIGNSAFYGCSALTSLTIPSSVINIGQQAFYGSGSTSITIENNNLTNIGQNAFSSQTKLYAKRGTKTLLTLWKNGYTNNTYEIGTGNRLPPSSLSIENTTQMTATVKVNDYYDGFTYTLNDESIGKNTKTFYAPYPEYNFNPLKVSLDDVIYTTTRSFQTKGLNMTAQRTETTASSMTVKASYEHGDAPVTAQTLTIGGVTVEGDEIYLNGLKPNTSYTVKYTITVNGKYDYSGNFKFTTNALKLTTLQPRVIKEGDVIVASESNLDDEETNVGFEWRRTDWTNEFQSNKAGAYLYEGMMEGYIRNMNTNFLWKYRPYYEANDGSRYYGEWLGIDPTNTSYFEPTVHTYAKIEVNGNRAKVKGYAMRGSDEIVSQGFRYWRNTESATRARQVEAVGQIMTTELKQLDSNTAYRVVAFVTTSGGETFYGKEQSFTTGDQTGIEETYAEDGQKTIEEGIYDLSGRKLERMQKGINIVRQKDGTTRKVLVK